MRRVVIESTIVPRKPLVLSLSVLIFAGGVQAEEHRAPAPLDLAGVVELALARNPGLQAEIEQQREVEQGIREARAEAWPQVDLVSSWNLSRNPALLNSPDFDDIIRQFPDFRPGEQELWTLSLELRQALYSSGKVKAGIELAGLVVDVTEARIEVERLATAVAAAVDYYRLLAAESALETVEIQRQARGESLAVAEARYELGEATRLELLRSRAALAAVEPAAARIRGAAAVAKSRLRQTLGLAAGSSFEVVSLAEPAAKGPRSEESPSAESPSEESPSEESEPPPMERLMELARERRPELRDLHLQAEALKRQKTVVLADAKPQVDLSGAYGRQVRLLENLDDPLYADWRVGVVMSWSLFDGGRRKSQAAQLDSRRDQLGWQLADLESGIAAEIEEALAELRTAGERWRAAQVSAETAGEATRVARDSYQQGVALQADLLAAQEQEIQAELVLIESFYDARIADARLRRAVGVLPTAALTP